MADWQGPGQGTHMWLPVSLRKATMMLSQGTQGNLPKLNYSCKASSLKPRVGYVSVPFPTHSGQATLTRTSEWTKHSTGVTGSLVPTSSFTKLPHSVTFPQQHAHLQYVYLLVTCMLLVPSDFTKYQSKDKVNKNFNTKAVEQKGKSKNLLSKGPLMTTWVTEL